MLRRLKMKNENGLLILVFLLASLCVNSGAAAKTAKECIAEWRADKSGMQARGVTEKAYVEQCKGDAATPAAAAPERKPAAAAPVLAPAPNQSGGSSAQKTAKECVAEWRADKDGMQARGVTQKAYVEQCRGGVVPPAAASERKPTAAAPVPAPAPNQSGGSSAQKTAKECVAEWRADKAGMQARGTTEKAYVEACRSGGTTPAAAAPEQKPVVPAAPAPKQAAPARSTNVPSAPPAQAPSAANKEQTLAVGQFAEQGLAKARCPTDTVVWLNIRSKIYHFAGSKSYGTTEHGAYMCEKEALAAANRASKSEKHP